LSVMVKVILLSLLFSILGMRLLFLKTMKFPLVDNVIFITLFP